MKVVNTRVLTSEGHRFNHWQNNGCRISMLQGKRIVVPSESLLTFRLKQNVTVQ